MQIEFNPRKVRRLVFSLVAVCASILVGVSWFLFHIFLDLYELEARLFSVFLGIVGALMYVWFYLDTETDIESNQVLHIREFYETLYEQSPLPYLTIAPNGTIYTSNLSTARLLNQTPGQLTGRNFFHYLTHDDENVLALCISKIERGLAIDEQEMQLRVSMDDTRWISLSIFINQTFNQILVSMIDVTEKKKVDIAKSEFAALVTHQLRTPVAAIRWNVELLARTVQSETNDIQKKYFEKINRNITRMVELINDFLSVSKLETGTFETDAQTIQVKQYFDAVMDEYIGILTEKNLFIQRISDPEDLVINIDTRLFHIITSNLLSNAVKYTPKNGTISFGYNATNNAVIITVTDTGIGIPQADQENLFTKFYRASNAIRHKAEGTGLGLYIVKQSVQKLGGTINVSSIENQGTTFVVTIPRQ